MSGSFDYSLAHCGPRYVRVIAAQTQDRDPGSRSRTGALSCHTVRERARDVYHRWLKFNETLTILGAPTRLYSSDPILLVIPPVDTLTTSDSCFLHFSLPHRAVVPQSEKQKSFQPRSWPKLASLVREKKSPISIFLLRVRI